MSGTPPTRRVIRLFPGYGRDWPLWENSTPTWDLGYTTTPAEYGLSSALTRDLAEWNTLWEANFDPFEGWKNEPARESWRESGDRIATRLQEEVRDFADVQYEPWPLGGEHGPWGSTIDG
ncbi:hypothetical protein P2P98_03035 [Microbacterium sp. Kw_RZR3]|uniref:hypothetical protein n=1 Tax=Microbacterium sp. Kw_RZR3 TaxID=3032903 RepID=UPI0023DC2506|nr:hypothetical protein [Microbacterium sp. Kw_RZR3]MDF2045123.1 hypothetical protein [Microbacterium sp. Kw_RZR3]